MKEQLEIFLLFQVTINNINLSKAIILSLLI